MRLSPRSMWGMFGDAHHLYSYHTTGVWSMTSLRWEKELGTVCRTDSSGSDSLGRTEDRCRKTLEPHFFLQTNMQQTLREMAVAARTTLLEAGLWKGTIPS